MANHLPTLSPQLQTAANYLVQLASIQRNVDCNLHWLEKFIFYIFFYFSKLEILKSSVCYFIGKILYASRTLEDQYLGR